MPETYTYSPKAIKTTLQSLTAFFLPAFCEVCKKPLTLSEDFLCLHCLANMPFLDKKQTELLLPQNDLIKTHGITNTYILYAYEKSSKYSRLIFDLKYNNKISNGKKLGLMLGNKIMEENNDIDIIVPTPLHIRRKLKRGYNQSEKIAIGISKKLQCPIDRKSLRRIKYTNTQTKKGKSSRWENMQDVFTCKQTVSLKDKNILLVDDVLTTGATLLNCADALHKAGVKSISIACLAATTT